MTTSEIVAVAGVVISALSLCGISYAMKIFWESKAEKKKQQTEEYKKAVKEERMSAVREVIKEELIPLHEDIDNVGKDVKELQESDKLQKLSLQTILKDRLYELYNYCMSKGFSTLQEKQNFQDMYDKYHKLGENGVMDESRKKFMDLPDIEQYENK